MKDKHTTQLDAYNGSAIDALHTDYAIDMKVAADKYIKYLISVIRKLAMNNFTSEEERKCFIAAYRLQTTANNKDYAGQLHALMMPTKDGQMEQHYLCTECDFHGTADQFDRHVLEEGYNYGHGDAAPEEVELECPECGLWEQDGIVEAECCDYCEKHYSKDDIIHLEDANICIGCRVKRNIMKGDTK